MNALFLSLLALSLGFGLYVRLAPSDPARWHVAPDPRATQGLAAGTVKRLAGAAVLRLAPASSETLAALDRAALATARTRRLAGSAHEGRITWVTRSKLWAFPDYTTADLTPEGLFLHARLRFGRDDLGVNAARLRAWAARIGG